MFQEYILPPRVLLFIPKQIFWECLTDISVRASLSEYTSFSVEEPRSVIRRDGSELHEAEHFVHTYLQSMGRACEAYTLCALTKPSDKLIVFFGVARLDQDITGDEYLAGLRRSHLLEQLDWHVY